MIDQIGIAVLGVTAIWLSQAQNIKARRWSSIFGLAAQPFWFYTTFAAGQWGIFVLTFIYTAAWGRGVYTNWIAK